jgi:hypothetical protein
MDLRSMSRPKVLLAKLSVRTSAKGRQYLAGWLGNASVVGFEGEPDKNGNLVWDILFQNPSFASLRTLIIIRVTANARSGSAPRSRAALGSTTRSRSEEQSR